MKKITFTFTPFLIILPATLCLAQQNAKLNIHYSQSGGLAIVVDHMLHEEYGFEYPMTYEIGIPNGSNNLSVYRRYSTSESWSEMQTKTSLDFFNGVQAVRFDYANNMAYVSAAFSTSSDSLFMEIVDGSGNSIVPTFEGISKYYDNRQAAVTVSADDWSDWTVTQDDWFRPLLHLFRSDSLYVTVGVITHSCTSSTWRILQSELDSGYVEAASHSRTHSATPYADPVGEIEGSKQEILSHVILPAPYNINGTGLVYTWIAPYGDYDSTVDSLLGVYGYIDARLYANLDTTAPREYIYGDSTLTSWNVGRNHFDPFFPTVELGAPSWGGGDTSLTSLNNLFDTIVAKGDVYLLMWHPQVIYSDIDSSYLVDHLSHISGRTNVWYANLGMIYLYHMLQESNNLPVDEVTAAKGTPNMYSLSQNYPNPFNPSTVINYQLSARSFVTLKVYDVLGREVRTLVDKVEQPGSYSVTFSAEGGAMPTGQADPSGGNASALPSGVYFYRLQAGSFSQVKKSMLLR